MSSHEQDTPASDLHIRTQVQQLPEGTSSDDVNSTSPNFGTFTGPSVPGYPFLSQPQASGEIGRLGDYRVLAKLGEGGMGFVFRAEDPALKRFVALKVMRPEVAAKPLAADRFLREGRAAAGLKSDHIITIYQVGQANGAPFIAMEYLEGIALDEWMKQQKKAVPVPHVLRVVRDTLRGLATAHDKGLIHRDIKPANLWIEKGTARIKVLDFGLTRGMDGNDQMTADGAVVGTPAYMAPEQAAGKPVDPRADLFSVGTVMYQLFLGINPFVRNNMMATMNAVSYDVPPPVVSLRPEVPQAYSDYLDRLLAKDPAGRPANAKAALAELAAIEKSLQDSAKTTASASSIPVVSMMAPAAAPVVAQVWGDITDSEDAVVRTKISDPETPRKPPSKKLLIGSGLFAFFALVLAGIIIVITNKDGTKTKVEVPDGATVDVQKDGKTVASVGGKKAEVPKAKAAMDPARKAAEFVIGKGGYVVVLNPGKEVYTKEVKDLPKEPFQLREIGLNVEAAGVITDADLDQFRELNSLDTLDMIGPNTFTDAGLAKLAGFPFAGKLRILDISGDELTDAAFASAAKFTSLSRLTLQSKRITGSGIAHLKASSIGSLVIGQCRLVDAEMVHLKAMPKLGVLTIIGTPIGDAGLKHISEVKQLETLQMQNCDNVTIAGMKHLEKCESLQHIELNSPMTGACFESLSKINTLTTISALIEVTDTDVKHLVGLPKLENLRIPLVSITDVGLESLSQIKTLKFVSVKGSKVTAAGVKKFRAALPECKIESDFDADPARKAAEFVIGKGGFVVVLNPGKEVYTKEVKDLPKEPFKLRDISFETETAGGITDADLDQFRELESLDSFLLACPNNVTDAGLTKLAGYPFAGKLVRLHIHGGELTDDAFRAVAKFPTLGHFAASRSKRITGSGIAHLKASSVQMLSLASCGLLDAEMVHLKAMPNLNYLQIISTPIGDAGLKHISEVSSLTQLQMQHCLNVTDVGIKNLIGLQKLELLECAGLNVPKEFTSASLETIGQLKKLKVLSFFYFGSGFCNDADLKQLVALDKLESLSVVLHLITDDGLTSLAKLKSLKALDLKGSKVTAAGVKKFRAALPECKVTSDFDKN